MKIDKVNESGLVDSGERQQFSTGAEREIIVGKGRFDLIPLDICGHILSDNVFIKIQDAIDNRDDVNVYYLYDAIHIIIKNEINEETPMFHDPYEIMLELAKHFENGAIKYEPDNWKKGLPVHCYIDSACRHYCKYKARLDDEPHLIASIWNLICCIWTIKNIDTWEW